jgi:hypothetical protein
MAAIKIYQRGLGGSSGHALTTATSYMALSGNASASVVYVGPGGTDAAAPVGFRREAPLATLAQAHTNIIAGDTIVLLAGHTETLGSAQTFNKANVTVVSEGTGANRARFTCSAAINMFDVTAVGVQFLNLYFTASTAAATARVRTAASGTIIEDCQFDSGASDTTHSVLYINGANYAQIRGTTFTSTASGAVGAISVDSGATMSGLQLVDVTVDGGSFGWTTNAITNGGTLTGVKVRNLSLLNNSDAFWGASPTGYVVPGVCTGSAYFLQS